MTKLETELREAITGTMYLETSQDMTDVEKDGVAKAAAEVCKRYIEKYHHDICEWDGQNLQPEEFLNKWLKENSIV
jgi:hypothetical protein